MANNLPDTGFLRLKNIIGDKKAKPPTPALIPVSKTTLYEWVRTGRFPRPIALGPGTTAWRCEDIRAYIEQAAPSAEAA